MASIDLPIAGDAKEGEESAVCLLEDTDQQCGHVFYNEESRVLKFFCTFCRETYDNINFFCLHLSDHIAEELKSEDGMEAVEETETSMQHDNDTNSLAELEYHDANTDNEEIIEYPSYVEAEGEDIMNSTDDTEIIDELDEFGNSHVIETSEQMLEAADTNTTEFKSGDEAEFIAKPHVGDSQKPLTDSEKLFERQLRNRFINLKSRNIKKKKKRVTTVKVIAVKNRIAELYERIKREEARRSQELDEGTEQTDQTDAQLSSDGAVDNKENETQVPDPTNEVPQRQIIGETLITLLPSDSNAPAEPTPTIIDKVEPPVPKPRIAEDTNPTTDRTCLACGKVFRNSFSLSIHRRSHYLESDSSIKLAHKCSDCEQLFNKLPELKEHVKQVHYPDGFVCKICNKRLTGLSQLEMHMRRVHLARPFNCEICKKCFSNRDDYDVHVNSHLDGTDFRCYICGRKYPSENVLQYHLKRHKEPVPQCCVVCGKMTLRITQHMKTHTPRPKRILSCSVCGKVFNFSSGLSHHFKVMHKLPRPPPKPKKPRQKQKVKPFPTDGCSAMEVEPPMVDAFSTTTTTEVAQSKTEWTTLDEMAMDQKEEEAKRVIVELIQNAAYTPCFLPDNNHYEVAPPIAREETISAINSIVPDELDLDIK